MEEIKELKIKVETIESLLTQIILQQTQESLYARQMSQSTIESLDNHKSKISIDSNDINNLLVICKNLDTRLRYVEDFLRVNFEKF